MRKKLKKRKFVAAAALSLASAGFLLRLIHLRSGTPVLLAPLSVLAGLAVIFAGVTAWNLKPRPGFAANNRPSTALLLELLAALLLLIAAVIQLFTGPGLNRWLLGLSGMAGAVCMGAVPVQLVMRKQPSLYYYVILTMSLILKLILEFRVWSVDPLIGDYCFRLFAMIAVMCVSYHRGGFVMNSGKRRITVFWCIAGIFFCGISIADGSLTGVLSYLSYLIYLGAALWSLMAPPRKRRRAIPVPDSSNHV